MKREEWFQFLSPGLKETMRQHLVSVNPGWGGSHAQKKVEQEFGEILPGAGFPLWRIRTNKGNQKLSLFWIRGKQVPLYWQLR
jgi:hypothetical protein